MPLTGRNTKKHRYQAHRIAVRTSASISDSQTYCNVMDCRHLRLEALGKGVGRYCQVHQDHQRRHGHPTRASFTLDDLGSYRRAAWEWLTANRSDMVVSFAVKAAMGRMGRAGLVIEPNGLTGASLRMRADAVWSRLRRREIDPLVLLAVAIGIEGRLHDDADPPRDRRYARVQMAKVLNRLAGGLVKKWQRTSGAMPQEVIAFQQSRGLFLITVGKDLERISELVTERHLEAILKHHAKRKLKWKRGRVRPYPVSEGNRARKAVVSLFDDGQPPGRNLEAPAKEIVKVETATGHTMTVVRH